jgi:4-hydroxy-2-oxoheptanedioate aldolase
MFAFGEDSVAIGTFLTLPDEVAAQLLSSMAFEWICIDLQHGNIAISDLVPLLSAIELGGATPLVRVSSHDRAAIGHALDAGAAAVIVPDVRDRAQALAVVRAMKYPPLGDRSVGPYRARLAFGADYVSTANDKVGCIVMIESGEGVSHVEEILGVPGIDGVMVGQGDLGLSLRAQPEADIQQSIDRIFGACREAGVPYGTFVDAGTGIGRWIEAGVRFVSVGNDAQHLYAGASNALSIARSDLDQ